MTADGNPIGTAYGQIRPNCIVKTHLWIYAPTGWLRCSHAAMGRTVLAHEKDGGGAVCSLSPNQQQITFFKLFWVGAYWQHPSPVTGRTTGSMQRDCR